MSNTASNKFSRNTDSAPSVRSAREQSITSLQEHFALELGDSSACPPIVVLFPDQEVFGRVMGHLLPTALEQSDWQKTNNVVRMRSEPARAFSVQSTFTFGEVTVDAPAMEVRRNGKLVVMRMKEFSMLVYMARKPGRVIPRDELLNEVWGYNCYPHTRTVDNHILRLRQKLEIDPSRPKHFVTVHCAGYKFLP